MHPRISRSAIGLPSAFAIGLALVLTSVSWGVSAEPAAAADFPSYDSGYHTYAEMVTEIMAAQTAYPGLVAVHSIGKSYQGRDIWVAKISDNVATDEDEPEVLFDSLHHAREHLSLEQDLAILRWLTTGYGTDSQITNLVNTREIWIIFAVNPDGAEYDLTGSPYPLLAQEPPAERRARQSIGTDVNRNYGYHWACCGGSSSSQSSVTYHGPSAFSTPEARAVRDFIASRRIGGRQQIRTAITFHTAGEQILWPYGYTKTDVPCGHDDRRPRGARRARQARWPPRTATRPMQSSSLYVTDGDEIDWAYGVQHIFMYTFELYPSHSKVSSDARFYPPDEVIGPQTERNKAAILDLIDGRRLPVRDDRQGDPGLRPAVRHFETYGGWIANPLGTDTATGGRWQRANPAATSRQAGTVPSGSRALVTGAAAGSSSHANDVDGGVTTMRSRRRSAAGPGRLADLPLLLRPQLELVVGRLLPRVRRGRGRPSDAGPRGDRGGEDRSPDLDDGLDLDDARGPARRSGSCSPPRTSVARARSRPPSTTSGSLARKREPDPDRGPAAGPGRNSAAISPPWATTSWRAIARPSPEPRESSPLTNRSKTCGSSAGSMPRARVADLEPEPAAVRSTDPATVTRPPAGVWRRALATRLREDLADPDRVDLEDRQVAVDRGRQLHAGGAAAAARTSARRRATSTSGSVGSGWSARVPASDRASVRRSSISRPRTRVSSRTTARWAGSGG